MVAFSKFNTFVDSLSLGKVNLNNTIKFLLMAGAVNANDSVVNTSITPMQVQSTSNAAELTAGFGYSSGGFNPGTSYSYSAGTSTLTATDFNITATGGTIGPFLSVVAYDTASGTSSTRPVIGYWNTGSISVTDGNTLNVKFTVSSKVLTIT